MYKTMVVVDGDDVLLDSPDLEVISFERYLTDYPKINEPKTRIINLCNTDRYLSKGYYCSLIAEARQHKVLPSVGTINELRDISVDTLGSLMWTSNIDKALFADKLSEFYCYFGWTENPAFQKLARKIFEKYPAPILKITLSREQERSQISAQRYSFSQLEGEARHTFLQRLSVFTQVVWRSPSELKRQRWDMAILVNPEETHPPSDKEAIAKFVKAASKVGIHAEVIHPNQVHQIPQYDALFVRETTAIDHHTYRIVRKAEQEGLIVIDDSVSILRCCNKVFLHDSFSYNKVPSLKTKVVVSSTDEELDKLEELFAYPFILKTPEGAFSRGVFKVADRAALKDKLLELFEETALVLAQEYFFTDYDWRIGVLNGRAIFACRYYMARNHWQIYNHNSKRHNAGNFETLPTFEAPKLVLDAAVKAANSIGNGLYGVDIKQKGHQVFVIEVNDNPNIDHKVEDIYLGNELYMLIMSEFAQRLEQRGR
jgi:glutathione synthase/RimK-type ligase-like ATP-grasp enzyme